MRLRPHRATAPQERVRENGCAQPAGARRQGVLRPLRAPRSRQRTSSDQGATNPRRPARPRRLRRGGGRSSPSTRSRPAPPEARSRTLQPHARGCLRFDPRECRSGRGAGASRGAALAPATRGGCRTTGCCQKTLRMRPYLRADERDRAPCLPEPRCRPVPRDGRAVPRWARVVAHIVPLTTLPSALWRIAIACGFSLGMLDHGEPIDIHGWESVYLICLSLTIEGCALLAVGLVRPWGERVPRCFPVI